MKSRSSQAITKLFVDALIYDLVGDRGLAKHSIDIANILLSNERYVKVKS